MILSLLLLQATGSITLPEAEVMKPAELGERVLGATEHRPIVAAQINWSMGPPTQNLHRVVLVEQAEPMTGRICRARQFTVEFVAADNTTDLYSARAVASRPDRITQDWQLAVPGGGATATSCAATTDFASVDDDLTPEAAAQLIEKFAALSRSRARTKFKCTDEEDVGACRNPRSTFASLRWEDTISVGRGNPPWGDNGNHDLTVTLGRKDKTWSVSLTPEGNIVMTRSSIPPF